MHYIDLYGENIFGPGWGLNGRLTDSETCTLPTTLLKQGKILPGKIVMQFLFWHSTNDGDVKSIFTSLTNQKYNASAGNRTRVNCLEGSYAHHYTTDAVVIGGNDFRSKKNVVYQTGPKNVTAVTRIRTWVTAATTQGPNH